MENSLEIFNNINKHILEDDVPSKYLNSISETEEFKKYPFSLLYSLKSVEQSPIHHPEGNVWKHTMMVLDEAAKLKHKSSNQKVLMWAALLHDIGKPSTTRKRKGRITSYGHDKAGENLSKDFLKVFVEDDEFINKVAALVRWHMQILFVVKNMPFGNIEQMKSEANIEEVALLGLSDRLGRGGTNKIEEEENIKKFIEKCKNSE